MVKVLPMILGATALAASSVYATPTKVERGYYTTNAILGGYQSPPAATQTVHVGGSSGLVYTPEFLSNIAVGTVIEFQFDVKNHTLTQSTFPEPCVHMDNGMGP